MTPLRLKRLHLENYRCFESLDLALEDDLTVLFAENGGGKTALLSALAMGLAVFQTGAPRDLKLAASSDPRQRTLDDQGRREPAGPCTVSWTAATGGAAKVEWSTKVNPASGRTTKDHRPVLEAIEQIRVPGDRWPLFAWYGVNRLQRRPKQRRRTQATRDRWEAYASSLDPELDDAPLLQWLQDEMLGDVVRQRQGEPERFFEQAVMEATVRATPGVSKAWYDPVEQSPMVRFEAGHVAPWSELSDGYHVFMALVADIARRAVMLNEIDGAEAVGRVEGVVLIDEIDLHLHPKWQRVALHGLRKVFPRLQLVVSTHSPQILSSAENRQARRLMNGRLQEHDVFVQGRDSNAILREFMRTDDRDEQGTRALRDLHDAIDRGDRAEAERLYAELVARWGEADPALIRAKGFMDWEG
ncbi:MAG: ATP binding protein [Candidatus Rokubacteria bacterium]|nr:ATP binding protein [Candidatus Rokubacteria bacterium]